MCYTNLKTLNCHWLKAGNVKNVSVNYQRLLTFVIVSYSTHLLTFIVIFGHLTHLWLIDLRIFVIYYVCIYMYFLSFNISEFQHAFNRFDILQ